MELIGADWTAKVNTGRIKCSCGAVFLHPLNRWKVKCPECHALEGLDVLRKRFQERMCMDNGGAQ